MLFSERGVCALRLWIQAWSAGSVKPSFFFHGLGARELVACSPQLKPQVVKRQGLQGWVCFEHF